MDLTQILIPVLLMSSLGILLSVLLSLANKQLYVYEDPKINTVSQMLPGTNCGACGEPGCQAFAQAIVNKTKTPGKCTVSSEEQIIEIADFLGVGLGKIDRQVARLACAGGTNVARQAIVYSGHSSCRSAALVTGGGKSCSWGCLGLGDCEVHCEFDAISMNEHKLPVVDEKKCTACNDCVEVCPKDLFELSPVSSHLWVACKNLLPDEDATNACQVACTGCGLCVADAANGVIHIKNNLAIINFNRIAQESREAIGRCPTGAITWHTDKGFEKGSRAKKIIRKNPIPVGNI